MIIAVRYLLSVKKVQTLRYNGLSASTTFFSSFFGPFCEKKALRTTEEFYRFGGTEGQFLLLVVDALYTPLPLKLLD